MLSRPLRCLAEAPSPHVIRSMRERIDLLEEEVRQYREAIEVQRPYPEAWRLTKYEGRMLKALARAKGGYVSTEQLLVTLYGLEPDVEPKIVDVWICKLRKKLAGTGIEIRTSWGVGFGLSPESVLALRRIVAENVAPEEDARVAAEKAAAAKALLDRVASLEAENAALKAAITAAGHFEPGPATVVKPRRSWRDFAKPERKERRTKAKGGRHAR